MSEPSGELLKRRELLPLLGISYKTLERWVDEFPEIVFVPYKAKKNGCRGGGRYYRWRVIREKVLGIHG